MDLQSGDLGVAINTTWVLLCAFLVFFMNAGFGCVEAGFCRSKNTVNILAKNFVIFALASIAYWMVGFGLMFGDGNSLVGLNGWFVTGADSSPMTGAEYTGVFSALSWAEIPLFVKFFFQLAFAATAATIVSGCVAERIHYVSFMFFALFLVAIVYPISGHWIWGGGWLQEIGMWDFAGSTVVHSAGGWAGLAGVLLLGPRLGKYRGGKTNAIPGHSMPLAFLGGMILWLGWFGFNPGSTMAITGDATALVGHIVVTTNLACAAGIILATLTSYFVIRKPDFSMTVNGALAGLVGITASCAFVTPFAAVGIGAVAGVLVVYGVRFFDAKEIDDPVGALSVHLLCGIWGTLAVGIFASTATPGGIDANGLLYGGGGRLLGIQALGVIAVGAFVFGTSYICWKFLQVLPGIRVSGIVEIEGLDVHEMGAEAYPHERAMDLERLLAVVAKPSVAAELTRQRREPRAADYPGGKPPYTLTLHNVDMRAFMERWRKLCGADAPASEDFRMVYKYFTTIEGSQLRFRGGNPHDVREKLQAIASTIDPGAFAEVKVGWTKKPAEALAL